MQAAGSRQQAAVILNRENVNVGNIGQGEAQHRKYKRLKLVTVRHIGSINCLDCGYILGQYMSSKHYLLYKT
jgi:hypothetical protein